jgi:hypothetical protein
MSDHWSTPDHRLPDPRMIAAWQPPTPRPDTADEPHPPRDAADGTGRRDTEPVPNDPVVRPFLLTGGRTRPVRDGIRVESIVVAAPAALHAPLRFESRSIVEHCQRPQSVAEVASALRLPLGVAKVLVADLVTERLVTLAPSTEVPIDVIERIRDCVRAL